MLTRTEASANGSPLPVTGASEPGHIPGRPRASSTGPARSNRVKSGPEIDAPFRWPLGKPFASVSCMSRTATSASEPFPGALVEGWGMSELQRLGHGLDEQA